MSPDLSIRELAAALGGDVAGAQVLAPGPGHSTRDRSMAVRPSPDAQDGFVVMSFAGDDWRECRDYVRARLRLPSPLERSERFSRRREISTDDTARTARALSLWEEAGLLKSTLAERYLASRGLALTDDMGHVLRFHPRCPFGTERLPCLIALYRDIVTDKPVAIHRTALTPEGEKIDRKMLGPVAGAAIKLDCDAHVTQGLTVGEGLESCFAGHQLNFRPAWALGSSGAIAAFPVLAGVEALTILAEHDAANAQAMQACGERWAAAGREVLIVNPLAGNDVNDAIREAAA